jgi:hypothetical protein
MNFYILSTPTCFNAYALSSWSLIFFNFNKYKIKLPEDEANVSKHVGVLTIQKYIVNIYVTHWLV